MTDSTPNDPVARHIRRSEIVGKMLGTIDHCDVFHEALHAFEHASVDARSARDEDSLQNAAVGVLDYAATALMVAAADYYCAHSLFDIFTALDAHAREQADANAPEQGRL